MFEHLKRLGTDTAIYGVSTIVGRFLNFLLVPLYTNVLLPEDYGIVTYLYSLIAFMNVIYAYGMESAYFKYSSTLEHGTPQQNYSTAFLSILGSSIFLSAGIIVFHSSIGLVINIPDQYESLLLYTAGILAFDAIAIIPFAALRSERKAKLFASIKVLNIAINLVLNIILIVILQKGVQGIFISGFVASVFTFIMLIPTMMRNFRFDFSGNLYRALLKFGLPTIPAGLASMAIQVIDRPILRALTDDATVGIYQANYRLGIFMMLIVSMFDYAWRPFYFSVAKEPNAKEIFARVLTYLLLCMSLVFLVLTFFIEDIVKINFFGRHIIHPDYWSGLNIVPIVLLGYLFLGVSTTLSAGIYIEKRTQYLPIITFVGAGTNIMMNYLLIPSMGIYGAALATLAAYFIMSIVMYIVAQSVFPIRFEYVRIVKILIAILVVVGLNLLISLIQLSGHLNIASKIVLIFLFLGLMYLMKVLKQSEIVKIINHPSRIEETNLAIVQQGKSDVEDSV
ncbi:MAG TPA: polysaccharide biosynthesis C-terminal domain-containing protein [Bacteroidota bacterium]|nr:polysaccharide biosynthesis C-terminal domain-containing protein [Bacteroidota bacterium]